ncbi:MAG: ABC transporter permease, partial [Anaerolineae bacterium]|nr:ABC transporter permease [Anaerolineae bacterium]
PRAVILGGKALGVLVMVLLQLLFLFVALSVISGLLYGIFAIWGTNLPAIALMLVFTALAAAGVGILIAAIAKTTEQASIVGSILAMFMGVLGGAFFPIDAIPVLQPFTRLSVVRWGSEGFNKLSQGNSDILVNLVFLALIGTALFLSGFVIFNRRQDI